MRFLRLYQGYGLAKCDNV